MVSSKNYLNLKSKISTPKKSTYSRHQIDSLTKKNISKIEIKEKEIFIEEPSVEESSVDDNKRLFLKVAGVAGIGLAAQALFPKSADAYIAGSTPASNVVGLKDKLNAKINPATEESLGLIKTNSDKFKFDVSGNLLTSSTGGSASVVGVKNAAEARINPATEESLANIGTSVNDQSIWMLRKIITLLKPLGMTTGGQSNRLSIDVNTITTLPTLSTVSTVTTMGTLTNLSNIGNVNAFSLMKDSARNAYANSIRSKISF